MSNNFYIWFSVISFIANLFLLLAGYGLYVSNRKELDRRNAQVKIWMHAALGVSNSLKRIVANNIAGLYSTVQDVTNSAHVAEAGADALFQSLYEERNYTDDEYKKQQQIYRDRLLNNQQNTQASESTTVPENAIESDPLTPVSISGHVNIFRRLLRYLHISRNKQ